MIELFTRATISSTTVSPNSTAGKSTTAAVAQEMRRLYIRTLEFVESVLNQENGASHLPGLQLTGLDALNCKWSKRGLPTKPSSCGSKTRWSRRCEWGQCP